MLQRDRERSPTRAAALDVLPLGAAALAGTTVPDRPRGARPRPRLRGGLARTASTPVSDRDFALEFLAAAAAICAMHLSRLRRSSCCGPPPSSASSSSRRLRDRLVDHAAEEEPGRGRADPRQDRAGLRRPRGLLTMMKGLPLAYNSDMQEDKEAFFDAVDTLEAISTSCRRCCARSASARSASAGRPARTSRRRPIWPTTSSSARPAVPRGPRGGGARSCGSPSSAASRLDALPLEELRGLSAALRPRLPRGATVEASLAARTSTAAPRPEAVARALAEARALPWRFRRRPPRPRSLGRPARPRREGRAAGPRPAAAAGSPRRLRQAPARRSRRSGGSPAPVRTSRLPWWARAIRLTWSVAEDRHRSTARSSIPADRGVPPPRGRRGGRSVRPALTSQRRPPPATRVLATVGPTSRSPSPPPSAGQRGPGASRPPRASRSPLHLRRRHPDDRAEPAVAPGSRRRSRGRPSPAPPARGPARRRQVRAPWDAPPTLADGCR